MDYKVKSGGRVLRVDESLLSQYLSAGYSVIDDNGNILQRGSIVTLGQALAELAELKAENSSLKAELAELKAENSSLKAELDKLKAEAKIGESTSLSEKSDDSPVADEQKTKAKGKGKKAVAG